MPTVRQKKAFKEITEKHRSVSSAMRAVGYTKQTATKPSNLTKSKGWSELMEQHLPDRLLARVHKEGLAAVKKENKIIGRDDDGKPEYEMVDVDDFATRHKYLDSAYKLKKKYPVGEEPNQNNTQINIFVSEAIAKKNNDLTPDTK